MDTWLMDTLWKDLRFASRMLRRRPGLNAAAVLCLALGIAGTTVVFSLVDGILLRPLPFAEAERLAMVWARFEDQGLARSQSSGLELIDYQAQKECFENLVGFVPWYFNLTAGGVPERLVGAKVSTGLFAMLGVEAALGRTFGAEDSEDSAVLLSHRLWRRRFGGDPEIIGRSITVEGAPHEVVGVLPQGFRLLLGNADLWVPYEPNPHWPRHIRIVQVLGKLAPGCTAAQAQAGLETVAARLAAHYPEAYAHRGWGLDLVPLVEEVVGDTRALLLTLLVAVGLVLAIACGSVANLLLARATARAGEIAVRRALGASGFRLVRQLLTESLLLAGLAGLLGLGLGLAGLRLVVQFNPGDLPRLEEFALHWRTFAFAAGVALLTGVVCGLAPALGARGGDLRRALDASARGSAARLGAHPVRSALVVVQVGLALVVLVGAGLMFRTAHHLERVELGFEPSGVVTVGMFLSGSAYAQPVQLGTFYVRLLEGLAGLPQIKTVGLISQLPLGGLDQRVAFVPEGQVVAPGTPQVLVGQRSINPDYFAALGIPLLQGRIFDDHDDHQAPRVVIVDQRVARRLWGERSALGQRVRFAAEEQPMTVVGVVGAVRHQGLLVDSDEQVYIPFLQGLQGVVSLALVSDGQTTRVADAVRQVVAEIDPQLPIARVQPMTAYVDEALAPARQRTVIFGLFAVIAVLLATVGILGVMTWSVVQRRRELGIRMALGARRHRVVAMVLWQAAQLICLGLALGLTLTVLIVRLEGQLLADLLAGTEVFDPWTFSLVSVGLAVAGLGASYLPARRASRIDPAVILREE